MTTPLLIVAGTLVAASTAFAQGAGGPGGQGVTQHGSATGPSNRGAITADPTNTPGWSMMSAEERSAHTQRMQSFKTYDECRGYMTQQSRQMNSRGAGPAGGASAGGDTCGHLPRS